MGVAWLIEVYYRAGSYLPINFEHVPLNKLQIQKLNDLGLEYNQDMGKRRNRAVAQPTPSL